MHQKYEETQPTMNWMPAPWQVEIRTSANQSWLHSVWVSVYGTLMLIAYFLWKTVLLQTVSLLVGHPVRIVLVGFFTVATALKVLFFGLLGYVHTNNASLSVANDQKPKN